MAASHGENFPSGVHGDGFQAIAAYFQQRSCRSCSQPYTPEGIEFVRQEPGVMVVRVGCSACGQPLGIALVGVNNSQGQAGTCAHGRPAARAQRSLPSEWSRKDSERLANKPKITYDDVLSAHQFFQSLEADWAKYLPKGIARKST